MSDKDSEPQLGLFRTDDSKGGERWPRQERFPTNRGRLRVGDVVRADLLGSSNPLLITGYASLAELLRFLPCFAESEQGSVRLLIGHEPHVADTLDLDRSRSVGEPIRKYWLEEGVDVELCYPVVQVREMIERGQLEVRTSRRRYKPVHAKLYVSDEAATLGSSNFSTQGLSRQIEANARFTREEMRHQHTRMLAERIWEEGVDFADELMALLAELLAPVPWQKALARSCATLLEGEWAAEYIVGNGAEGWPNLWPSQRRGLAEAMWVIENVGSVLVADATGSGKTRMGAWLLRAIFDSVIERGGRRVGMPVLVSPPMVTEHWATECTHVDLAIEPHSHGQISMTSAEKHERVVEAVERAQILALDEAHHYLNPGSNRTQTMLTTMAEHVVLFTATPINRGVKDMIALLNLLGPDNLTEKGRAVFDEIGRARSSTTRYLGAEDIAQLREEIGRFAVRRTKTQFNAMVDANPEAYTSRLGETCRFPTPETRVYALGEPTSDRELAARIREYASRLRGLIYFGAMIQKPAFYDGDDAGYLRSRKNQAAALAKHHVMRALRSSPAALVEHIEGTNAAKRVFGLPKSFKSSQQTGDIVSSLADLAGHPPQVMLKVEPDPWLDDTQAHAEACERETELYSDIARCVEKLSGERIRAKAAHLDALLDEHELVIAFDDRPITLVCLEQTLLERGLDASKEVFVVSGSKKSTKSAVNRAFALESTESGKLALCTDAMSEGINLQRASAIVHLDMPSVIRAAEQRIGRVDRMDSPYEVIEIWWPDDAEEFALRTDETFFWRHQTVDDLLGSNFALPDKLQKWREKFSEQTRLAPEDVAGAIGEIEADDWDGIRDAFSPVRALFHGPEAIIEEALYEQMRDIQAQIVSRVGLVESETPWAFFSITGGVRGVPRWVFMERPDSTLVTELGAVAAKLRQRLGPEAANVALTQQGTAYLERFLTGLEEREESLLPARKQRALDAMRDVLSAGLLPILDGSSVRRRLLDALDPGPTGTQFDKEHMAERWLELIRPVRQELLRREGRRRLITLERCAEVLKDSEEFELTAEQLRSAFEDVPPAQPVRQRVEVAVLGVPAA